MYNGRMWLVVKPTIGIPLFFGGVALTSLAVHTAVLTNTTWFPAFLNGRDRTPAAAIAAAPAPAAAMPVAAVRGDGSAQAALVSAQAAIISAQTALAAAQPVLATLQSATAAPASR